MKFVPLVSLSTLALIAAGCVGVSVNRSGSSTTASGTSRAGGSDPAVRLLATDVEFARIAAEQGAKAGFDHYCDANSMSIVPTGPNPTGPAGFATQLQGLAPGALTWTPRDAEVSASGDLGWTWGDFVLRSPKGEKHGRYVTVWRWKNGQWWIAADIGTDETP